MMRISPRHISSRGFVRCAAKREPKDPASFADMDEARRYLSSRASPSYRFGFTQTVEALASIANSRDRSNVLGSWYRDIVSRTPTSKLRAGPQARNKTDSATPSHEVLLAIESALACSSSQARRIASACPLLDEARCVDLHVKVVQLKAALPDCNVPVLIERRPEIFLGENIDDLLGTVSWRYNFLKTNMKGADVGEMVQEDPDLLFDDDVEESVAAMRVMWPDLDADALRNSCPAELCLLLRALSQEGPPSVM